MIIDVAKGPYYVKADGISDNAVALMKLRVAIAGKNKPHYTLLFPPGEVRYSNNRWLFGVESFEIVGNNTVFRSLYSGTDDAFQRPFFVGELLQNNALTYIGTKTYITADKFLPVQAGNSEITLSTLINTYKSGDRILLYYGNYADSGYPPPATAEWHEVERVTGNILTLKRSLEKSYLVGVWDNPVISGGGCGVPRLINLDRIENVYCKYAKFTGITFGNSTGGGMGNVIFPAERLEMVRCAGEGYFWPSENRTAVFEDMDVNEVEFDKLVKTVICNRVTFKGSPNGGGSIDRIIINDCQAGESMRFNSREVEIKNTHIRGNKSPDPWISSLGDYPARNPVRRLTIDSLTCSSGPDFRANCHINPAPYNSMVISRRGEDLITQDFSLVKTMEPDTTVLFNETGTNGGLVRGISYDGTYYVIKGTWNEPQNGETWLWSYISSIIDLGGHRVLDDKFLWGGESIRWKGNKSNNLVKTMCLNQDDFKGNRLIDIYGHILSINSYVSKSANIEIQNADPFENLFKLGDTFIGYKWVKQLYLIGTGGRFDIVVNWKSF